MVVACRIQPAAFAWFTPSFYAPGLGFLMFAVGVNLQLKAFATVFKTPKVKWHRSVKHVLLCATFPNYQSLTLSCLCPMEQLLLLGVVGQWVVKPLLGISLASTVVPALRLPSEVATGLVLVGSRRVAACCLVQNCHLVPLTEAEHENVTHALTCLPACNHFCPTPLTW